MEQLDKDFINIHIARYVGLREHYNALKGSICYENQMSVYSVDELQYHWDWNWLMKVVNRILAEDNSDSDYFRVAYMTRPYDKDFVYRQVAQYVLKRN